MSYVIRLIARLQIGIDPQECLCLFLVIPPFDFLAFCPGPRVVSPQIKDELVTVYSHGCTLPSIL